MLVNALHLKGLTVRATDGEIGSVTDFYFDDDTWGSRYLILDTGGWLTGRRVLISPYSILHTDWQAKRIDVALTKKQVQECPNIDTHKPISRQYETEYLGYYGYPYYWSGPDFWGPDYYPSAASSRIDGSGYRQFPKEPLDSHLRSADAVNGYDVGATDDEIGHVVGYVIDDESWAVRYLEIATRNWLPGKKVLISPKWIERISWTDSKVYTALTTKAIKSAPEYLEGTPITREYENQLYFHYGQPPYWLGDAERKAFSLASV